MIEFKISLLLAFNLNPLMDTKETPKSKSSKKSRSSSKSSKKTKMKSKGSSKSKRSKKSSGKKKTPKEERELEDYEFKVDKPLGYVHIDYNLLPKYKYKIDVVCWGPIAKVYTVDGQTCFKTIIKDGNAWVPVFLEHSRNPLQLDEVQMYKDYIITFNLSASKKNVAAKAKNDKTKMFYIKKENVASENFVKAYNVDPNLKDVELEKDKLDYIENLIFKSTNSPSNVGIDTWVHSQDETHSYNMLDVIKKTSNGGEIDCREYVPELPTEKNRKKAKEKKKNKKKKGGSNKEKNKIKVPTNMNIKIPAKLLYTDPTLVTYRLGTSIPAINHAFFLLSSKHLMSVEQKLDLAPFVIKVSKISNFPCDALKENGFDNVYVSCEIPNVISFETPIHPVAETIKLRESQIVFTKEKPKMQIHEYFHTQKVKLQIYGIKSEPLEAEKQEGVFNPKSLQSMKSKISGKNTQSSKNVKSKTSKSKKSTSKASKTSSKTSKRSNKDKEERKGTLLALAMFDVSSLMNNVWMFKEKGQCHNPNILMAQKGIEIVKFIDRYTIQEGNMIVKEAIPSPLEEELLLRLGTTIKLEAFFLAPQYPPMMNASNTFKRLLLIMFDVESTKSLLNLIFLHNQNLTRMETFIPNPIIHFVEGRQDSNHSATSQGSAADELKDVITGFVIDSDLSNFIIYVEGLSNGFILTIFHHVHYLNPSKAKVFYSSDYMFEDRLFPRCTLLIYNVVLKIPLEKMLRRPEIYIEGNVPLAGWKAILKLHLICTSQLFKSILQSALLPTEQEICCLDDEFGVSFRYMGDLPQQRPMPTLIFETDQQTELQLIKDFM